MQKQPMVKRGKTAGHVITVAPKKGYKRFVPMRYKKEREND
jgi:hypothetical protein